ncbi:hypothetical protein TNCV_4716261 [Trichonephila clavipes]|nr:hypothetical protein TNCV_4716261 [Trichonephila clavipes]
MLFDLFLFSPGCGCPHNPFRGYHPRSLERLLSFRMQEVIAVPFAWSLGCGYLRNLCHVPSKKKKETDVEEMQKILVNFRADVLNPLMGLFYSPPQ